MGNTVLMNRALARLAVPFPQGLHVHDYWIALMAELHGQRQLVRKPLVKYRLHASNASNTASSMQSGTWRTLASFDLGRWLARDFRLPFKEDTRLQVLESLVKSSESHSQLTSEQQDVISAFTAYLRFEQSRLKSIHTLLRYQFVRKGWPYRLRIILAVLLTRRYRK
jgi:hypothetical protein